MFCLCLAITIVALSEAWPAKGGQRPAGSGEVDIVRLTPAEATRLATAARQSVAVQLAQGLTLTAWAPDGLVTDPVALDFDERGTLYATSTSRGNLPLDIRQHPTWIPAVHSLRTVEDLLTFYRRELAPERSAQNPWLLDSNKDGSRDWRDFADVKERLYRIQDSDGDGHADHSRVIVEGFNTDPTYDVAGGLLHHNGDLFIGAPPALWRFRDANGDGLIESRVIVSQGYNIHPAFGGHGISGVTLGPDGRLYWEVGDMGFDVIDPSGRRWSSPNQGAVLRANPDGSDFEVFATGIRNLQEFAFDDTGISSAWTTTATTREKPSASSISRRDPTAAGARTGSTASTPIPPTIATTSGWMRGCSSPDSRGSPRTSRLRSRPTTPARRGWPTTLEPRYRTSGGIISSLPAFQGRLPTPASTHFG